MEEEERTKSSHRIVRFIDTIDAQFDHPIVQTTLPYFVVMCLVSALVWTWSISWVPPLLGKNGRGWVATLARPASVLPPSAVVVDCGSGKLAVFSYSIARR